MSWLPKGFEFLSGFPEPIRRKRVILTLQAIFDDSGSKGQGQFMAMAGLMGDATLIASIADNWRKYLRARHPGQIGYFKLDEAINLKGCFRNWQESNRDEKIRQMARVIDRDDLFEIGVALDLYAYERVFGPWEELAGGHSLKHPYMMLCEWVLSRSVSEAVNRGETKRIEIVYDEHKKFRPMFAEAYKYFLEAEEDRPERLALMPYQPFFRDDKEEFVVLQAADMLAGELRIAHLDDKPAPLVERLCPTLKEHGVFHIIVESEMREELGAHAPEQE
jgi:hypothetical protein